MSESQNPQSAEKPAKRAPILKLALLLTITAFFCICFALHVPHINSNPYWTWPYRRLHPWPLLPLLIAAIVPFVIAQLLVQRERLSPARATILLAISTLLIRYVCVACVAHPPALSIATRIVEHHTSFSYYHDAMRIIHDVAAHRLTWDYVLRHFPAIMPNLSLHSRIRPPGGILISAILIEQFGDPSAAGVLALMIAVVAALAAPVVYMMMRRLSRTPEESFAAASLLALCPGFVLFFPMFDPTYITVSALIVILWTFALRFDVQGAHTDRARAAGWAVLLGLILSAALFVTFNFLVLGIFLGGLALLRLRKEKSARFFSPTFIACLIIFATVVIVYLLTWRLAGFDILATMGTALANEHHNKVLLGRSALHSQFWDLLDFSLASGHLCLPLALMYVFSRLPFRDKLIPLLGLAQIAVVDLCEVLPMETTRVWLFLLPMLLIAAGAEITRWPPRFRYAVYTCLALMALIMCQNLWLVNVDESMLAPWDRPQKLTGPHARVILAPPGLQ